MFIVVVYNMIRKLICSQHLIEIICFLASNKRLFKQQQHGLQTLTSVSNYRHLVMAFVLIWKGLTRALVMMVLQ